MFLNDIAELTERINQAGKVGKPFLFGVDFELSEGFFVENPLNGDDVYFSVNGKGNKRPHSDKAIDYSSKLEVSQLPYDEYAAKFDIVKRGLMRGDSFLANLTVRTPIRSSMPPEDIFGMADAPYQIYVPGKFVCFSPERFVRIKDGRISTNPMKGTIKADVPDAENTILNDKKETAEHNTIVDLLRNDIGISASDVRVERFRYIDRIGTLNGDILQVSSEVTGKLSDDWKEHIGDIIFGMLPAGSVSGAPKQATLDIIRRAENAPRGYYTGIFGYFDGSELDSAVMIRFIELEDGKMYYRSGGGITAYSDCRAEYEEVLEKIYLPFK